MTTQTKGRPCTGATLGITSKIVAARTQTLRLDNKRLRRQLHDRRKMWAVELLGPLSPMERTLICARLAQLLTDRGARYQPLIDDLQFSKRLLNEKRRGPLRQVTP